MYPYNTRLGKKRKSTSSSTKKGGKTAKKTVSKRPNIEDHTQLVDAPPGGQSTVGHQGAWPYGWIPAPQPQGSPVPSNFPGYQPFSYPWPQPYMPQAVPVPNPQQQPQFSTPATRTQTGQTTSLEGTQGQAVATAPSQLIQAIGTANTYEQGELLCTQNVATVTKIITQPAQAPLNVNNISEDLDVNVPLNLKERIWKGEFIEMFQLIKKDRKPQPVGFNIEEGGLYL